MSEPREQSAGHLTGRILDHYRVEELVGIGGTGEVYRAVDLKLGRKVALKTLPPNVANDEVELRRFVSEAQAASSLNHSNIAHIYELGEDAGIHFIAMEFVGGRVLSDVLRSGPLLPERVSEMSHGS